MEAIITIIQTLGFPIACVLGLGYFLWKMYNNDRTDNNTRETNIMETLGELNASNKLILEANKEILEANRILMSDYKIYLQGIQDDVKDIKDKLNG